MDVGFTQLHSLDLGSLVSTMMEAGPKLIITPKTTWLGKFRNVQSSVVKKDKSASLILLLNVLSEKQTNDPYLLKRIPPLEINPEI